MYTVKIVSKNNLRKKRKRFSECEYRNNLKTKHLSFQLVLFRQKSSVIWYSKPRNSQEITKR